MPFSLDGRDYEIVFGSDVARNGFYAELNDISERARQPILFAFHSDADGKITVSAYRPDLPIELVERFLEAAKRRLPPITSPKRRTQP